MTFLCYGFLTIISLRKYDKLLYQIRSIVKWNLFERKLLSTLWNTSVFKYVDKKL